MPSIQVLPHSALSPQQKKAILDLCSEAYEEDFTPCFELLGEATHIIAVDSGEIVSHASWLRRQLRVGTQRIPLACAYIEAVATPTKLQRQGLGTLVLKALPQFLQEFDLAVLSPSEPAFYARCGWEKWLGPLSYIKDGRQISPPDEEVMIYRSARTPQDLDLWASLETDWREGDVW